MSIIATLVCLCIVAYLFWQDVRENPEASAALWIPLLWMFLAGSRYVSSWLNLSGPGGPESYDEGSPVDRAVFFALLLAGLVVLYRRRLAWDQVLACNKLLALYFFFCVFSILWTDDPFLSFKRWAKDMGNPVMAMVILTEPRPLQALGVVLRRLAYLLLPLSALFIRYFPDLGRAYHYDGSPMFTGVGQQKNVLGQMCLVTGIYFAWQVIQDRTAFRSWTRGRRLRVWALVALLAWLLRMSDSQTSLATLVVVASVLLAAQVGFVARKPARLVGLLVSSAIVLAILEASFDLKNNVLALLGRDPTLTNRTELWAILFRVGKDPVLGTGFMSFWSGERMGIIWTQLGAGALQAHSGYIEQYLNLGYVGVAFIGLLLVNGLFSAHSMAHGEPSFAHLRLCFIVAAVAYNYTEAAFYGVNNMWVLLLCGLIVVPQESVNMRAGAAVGIGPVPETGQPRSHAPPRTWHR